MVNRQESISALAEATENLIASRRALIQALDDVQAAATALDLGYIANSAQEMRSDVLLDTMKTVTVRSDVIAFLSLRANGVIP